MRTIFVLFLMSCGLFAQDNKPETNIVARTTFTEGKVKEYAFVSQTRGRWIIPDMETILSAGHQELLVGGGAYLVRSKHVVLLQEGYVNRVTNRGKQSELYFLPWTLLKIQVSQRVSNETVYFPYVPIVRGKAQHVLERSKLEYNWTRFKAGAGYSGYQSAATGWQHKPFITGTLKTKQLGSFELWLQRSPNNHLQVQVRYAKTFK